MYCPNCSEEYRPGVITCPDCGVALVPGQPPVSAASLEARRLTRRNIALVFIGLSVLAIVGGEAFGRAIGLADSTTSWLQVGVGAALLFAGLLFYSGTKRPVQGQTAADRRWDRL